MSAIDHEGLIAEITGGLAPRPETLRDFSGSDSLRADGRPRPDLRSELRRIHNLANSWTVAWVLAAPVLIVAVFVTIGSWWLYPVAFVAMGSMYPRFYVLNHEAAHRLLFSNRRLNDAVGQKLIGLIAFGDGGDGYRLMHAQHHRDEFGPKEPDLALYARYPIPSDSLRRKLTRDAVGVSGWKNLRPVFRALFRKGYRRRALKIVTAQAAIFCLFWLGGVPWLYLLLWFLPWMTYWRVVNRLRALAEHAGMTRSPDRRYTTHHITQRRLPAALFVPFNTGYHLAHHVDSGVAWRNLPRLHAVMEDEGYMEGVTVHRSYTAFWRTLTK
ncbi:MAG: fatty acid desaturase family protein [Acidimicrobiales bacterium]